MKRRLIKIGIAAVVIGASSLKPVPPCNPVIVTEYSKNGKIVKTTRTPLGYGREHTVSDGELWVDGNWIKCDRAFYYAENR